jgi:uncharacterized membrane protein
LYADFSEEVVRMTTQQVLRPEVLVFRGLRAYIAEAVFVVLAVGLPALSHAIGLPVFTLLPMHWTILLAGLIYGAAAGLIAGLAAPVLTFALTGMPIVPLLPLITLEVAVYGLVVGALREQTRIPSFAAIAVSLVAGRLVYVLLAAVLGRIDGSLGAFLSASFGAGVYAAIAQIVLLPVIVTALAPVLRADDNQRGGSA